MHACTRMGDGRSCSGASGTRGQRTDIVVATSCFPASVPCSPLPPAAPLRLFSLLPTVRFIPSLRPQAAQAHQTMSAMESVARGVIAHHGRLRQGVAAGLTPPRDIDGNLLISLPWHGEQVDFENSQVDWTDERNH